MASRSMPSPSPAVGGSPYSSARRYSSSTAIGLVVAGRAWPGRLVVEPGPLVVGVDQLAEGVAQLAAGHDRLEPLDQPGAVAVAPGQGRDLLGEVADEHRPPQLGLGRLLVDLEQQLARAPGRLEPAPPRRASWPRSSSRGRAHVDAACRCASRISSTMVARRHGGVRSSGRPW